jgi:hypothetical protein
MASDALREEIRAADRRVGEIERVLRNPRYGMATKRAIRRNLKRHVAHMVKLVARYERMARHDPS